MRVRVMVLLLLLGLARSARADEWPLDAELWRLHRVEQRLNWTLVIDGAVSMVAGAGLCVPSASDQAYRVAGGTSLAFGVLNFGFGVAGVIAGLREARTIAAESGARLADSERAKRRLLEKTRSQSLVYAVNLGLDVGYALAGLTAILASQLGVDHPDRWLAGGIATVVQALPVMAVDLTGVLATRRAQLRALEFAPQVLHSGLGVAIRSSF
jgi:hypothetical protein